MSRDDYNVYKGSDGLWRGKRQGAKRAAVTGDTQKEVFNKTRELAKRKESELSIHRGDTGRIREKYSYGNDPDSTEG